MILSEQNILFLARGMHIGGTEQVIIQLCEIFKPLVNKVIVCSWGGTNVKVITKMGIKHYSIPDMADKSLMTVLNISKKIKRIIRDEQITVIHTHCRMAAFYIQFLHLYKYCHFINTSHTAFHNKKVVNRYAYKNAHMIACGEMVKKNLNVFYGIDNVKVIHNAIKPYEGEGEEDIFLSELKSQNCFLIGNVSRLSEEKGVQYFILAAAKVLEKHKDARFIVVGIGAQEPQLRQLCKELKIEKSVFFLGYRIDIQNVIRQMDLMVLSSLMEGLPLTPIESFSVGKSMVATGVDGTVEIIRDGVDGFLVNPRDSDAIADRIVYLIEHPDIKRQFEIKAKERFEKYFSFERLKKEYIDYYRNL